MKSDKSKVVIIIAIGLIVGAVAGYIIFDLILSKNATDNVKNNDTNVNQVTTSPIPTISAITDDDKINGIIGTDSEENKKILEVDKETVDACVETVHTLANLMYCGFDCSDVEGSEYKKLQQKLDKDTFNILIEILMSNKREYNGEKIDITQDVLNIIEEKNKENDRLTEYSDITYSDWYVANTEKATAEYNRLNPKFDLWQPWQAMIGEEVRDDSGKVVYDGKKSLGELSESDIDIIKEYYTSLTGHNAVLETDEQYYEMYGTYPSTENNSSENDDTVVEWFGTYDGIDWSWMNITEDEWNRTYKYSTYTDEIDGRVYVEDGVYYINLDDIESNTDTIDLNIYGKYISLDVKNKTSDYTIANGDDRYLATIESYEFKYRDVGDAIECYGTIKVAVWADLYSAEVRIGSDGKIGLDYGFIENVCRLIYEE